jgi:hypothetical protein
VARQLGGHRGLADALEAQQHHRDHAAATAPELRLHRTHQGGELFLADPDEVLARRDPMGAAAGVLHPGFDLLPQAALLHASQEILHHLEVDVGLEQRHANVAQGLVDVLLGELPNSREPLVCALEAPAEDLEHASSERRRIREAAPAVQGLPTKVNPLSASEALA